MSGFGRGGVGLRERFSSSGQMLGQTRPGHSLGRESGVGRGWGEFWAELGSFGKGWLGERLGRASGELGESFGRAWKEAGESFGRAWGEAGESFGRASGKLRESLGRGWGEWGKLGKASGELGESFGKASGELGERLGRVGKAGESFGRAWGELRESFGRAWGEAGESFGRASGKLRESLGRLGRVGKAGESFGRAWKEAGESFGRAWGDAGESFGRASGKLRESLGRASGKLRAGERLGKAFREMWGEPWQQLWGRQSATRGPWSATTYHKQEPGTDDKVPSHLFSKHCVQAQKTYDLTRSGNHFREHLTFPWKGPKHLEALDYRGIASLLIRIPVVLRGDGLNMTRFLKQERQLSFPTRPARGR